MTKPKNAPRKATREPNMTGADGTKRKSSTEEQYERQKQENERLKEEIRSLKESRSAEQKAYDTFVPYVLFAAGVFFLLCFLLWKKMSFLGLFVKGVAGLLSFGAPMIALSLIVGSFSYRADVRDDRVIGRVALFTAFVVETSCLWHLLYRTSLSENERLVGFDVRSLYTLGKTYKGGGVIGGILTELFEKVMGVGTWFFVIAALVVTVFAIFRVTVPDIIAMLRERSRIAAYNARVRQKEALLTRRAERREQEALSEEPRPAEIDKQAAPKENKREKADRKKSLLTAIGESGGKESGDREAAKEEPPVTPEEKKADDGLDVPDFLSPDELRRATAGEAPVHEKSEELGGVPLDLPWEDEKPDGIRPDKAVFDKLHDEKIHFTDGGAGKDKDGVREVDMGEIFAADAKINVAGMTALSSEVLSDGASGNPSLSEAESTEGEIDPDADIDVETEEVPVEAAPKPEELYHFPSVDFLTKDPNPATFTVTDEIRQTSVKLVETLANFGVRTKITDICCGPTVTRYELQPEVGVRVKAIQNLSDDIALHLAAAGVRIEAPIPGKQAVGIEIPNSTVSTVYLRNLIENPRFEQQKSKLAVCLGMDVAGSPVYIDLAKMPHLLIAGATGMGKSVCINSFIVSILYKARPDECRLMLIDPKKVEFALYDGMPHLLVPVVSDPKKAAGALSWAVNEMERRFQLLEEVGVRDLNAYNRSVADDPEHETLPKIVIIIDELADLMMTARDSVENSICRIAQKARAAGMHLVIGTQRPSVDVVTGLIKANVPSRICCTVASQVDSRTVIDIAGAEKLLGRGDMLYAPVGCMKPIRVQGSFVDEEEIEPIVEALKNGAEADYDHDIMSDIEREAERCTEKKRGKGGDLTDDGEELDRDGLLHSDDAMIPALEVALDAGRISTSLLQTKLSLGYGRAARIIENLEKLGYIGGFEGSKPRRVLITREEYLRLVNREDA